MFTQALQLTVASKGTKFLSTWCALFAGQDKSIETHTPSTRAYRMVNPGET